MKSALIAYVSTAVAMLVLDTIWLSLAASRLYRPLLGDQIAENFNLAPAVLFYFLYVFGIVALIVMPALADQNLSAALWRGALLGLVAYATYDLTNQAVLARWSTTVTIADMCWGTFLTAVAAGAGYLVTNALAPRL